MEKVTKKEVRSLIMEFREVLQLEHWEIEVAFCGEPSDSNPDCAAECTPSNEYKSATISVFPKFEKELPETRRMIILHEMCHIITCPQHNLLACAQEGQFIPKSVSQYHYEETTTWIAQIIFALKK